MNVCILSVVMASLLVASSPTHHLRVLPLGDSLTQGVGSYESYRRPLYQKLIHMYPGTTIEFIGTRNGTCIPKHPEAFAPPLHRDFSPLHEGHCNWDSSRLRKHLPSALAQIPRDSVDVILFLIGHNDIFNIARTCKLREGIANDKPDCVRSYLASKTEPNLRHMMELLRDHSPKARLYLGLNPPAGFIYPTQELHRVLKGFSPAWVHRHVAFPQFIPGLHTFDTTHPNRAGEQVLASAWAEALAHEEVRAVTVVQTEEVRRTRRPPSGQPQDGRNSQASPLVPVWGHGKLLVLFVAIAFVVPLGGFRAVQRFW